MIQVDRQTLWTMCDLFTTFKTQQQKDDIMFLCMQTEDTELGKDIIVEEIRRLGMHRNFRLRDFVQMVPTPFKTVKVKCEQGSYEQTRKKMKKRWFLLLLLGGCAAPSAPPPAAVDIAVCIVGQERSFTSPVVYNSIRWNVLEALREDGGDDAWSVDTFVFVKVEKGGNVTLVRRTARKLGAVKAEVVRRAEDYDSRRAAPPSRWLLSALPSGTTVLTDLEFRECFTTYMGARSRLLAPLRGQVIPCGARSGPRRCDEHGHQLGLAVLPGGSQTDLHDDCATVDSVPPSACGARRMSEHWCASARRTCHLAQRSSSRAPTVVRQSAPIVGQCLH